MLTTAEELRAAAGGVVGKRRMHHRRGWLHDVCRLAEGLTAADERPVRELARTLLSEARRAIGLRQRGWLHVAVGGLALQLAEELTPSATTPPTAAGRPRAVPTSRCFACGAVIAASRRLCFPHWSQVPRSLQLALHDAPEDESVQRKVLAALDRSSGRVVKRPFVGRRPAEFNVRPRRRRE